MSDKDTISRTDAIELVKDVCDAVMSGCKSHYDSEVGDAVYDDILEVDAILKCNKEIRKALKELPSAQPERKKGRWIPQDHNKSKGNISTCVYYFPTCSVCGSVGNDNYNFCPNCGSDNRGEQHVNE